MAAAEEAAPIRREWEDKCIAPVVAEVRNLFMSPRVRKEPLRNMKRGEEVGKERVQIYWERARMGHKREPLADMRRVTPTRKGSVFDDLMRRAALEEVRVRSECNKVVFGSYLDFVGDVYSETRRKPKKAVRRAAHIISLSL